MNEHYKLRINREMQIRNWSPKTMKFYMDGLRFFYSKVCKPCFDIRVIPKMKVPKRFPKVFSREEVNAIINATGSIKERAMLTLLYSAGLRVNELVNIKIGPAIGEDVALASCVREDFEI